MHHAVRSDDYLAPKSHLVSGAGHIRLDYRLQPGAGKFSEPRCQRDDMLLSAVYTGD